jgi:uncharacterized membrane protein YbaN (DUF454 family)
MLEQQPPLEPKASDTALAKTAWSRWLWIALAWLCLLLGTIGIVVPGLPTIDFYILASIFAAKGSKRMHHWIIHHRWIGPVLKQWREQRTIPTKAKLLSLLSMSLAAAWMIWKVPHPWAVAVLIGCMVVVQLWMWTLKPKHHKNS